MLFFLQFADASSLIERSRQLSLTLYYSMLVSRIYDQWNKKLQDRVRKEIIANDAGSLSELGLTVGSATFDHSIRLWRLQVLPPIRPGIAGSPCRLLPPRIIDQSPSFARLSSSCCC
uniref:Uncharacterized protein n=1 Tax=Ananas comosus var. bracteatus TaxID=296719 RepID=A0A6V7PVA9_ANACO|nr:unnamed protein product [Ananas comosus var. bracteatus]